VILSGENVSRYSNKIESDGHNNKYFADLAQRHDGKTAGMDMV